MAYTRPSFLTYDEVIGQAAQMIRDRGMHEVFRSVLIHYASNACREFARLSQAIRAKVKMPLIPGQRLYPLPHDCFRPVRVGVLYPGFGEEIALGICDEKQLMDGNSRSMSGVPSHWYITKDTQYFGLFPIPTAGGFDGVASLGGTTSIRIAGASDTDDFYNGLTIRVVDGNAEGTEYVVDDYTGATCTLTPDSNFTPAVTAGDRIQIHPDGIVVEYAQRGLAYTVLETAGAVASSVQTPSYSSIGSNSTVLLRKPTGYFDNCELYFTSGDLKDIRTLVRSSHPYTGGVIFDLWPELPLKPANADTFTLKQCPNVPQDFQACLADYVAAMVLRHDNPAESTLCYSTFLKSIEDAKKVHEPVQGMEYPRIREFAQGEYAR